MKIGSLLNAQLARIKTHENTVYSASIRQSHYGVPFLNFPRQQREWNFTRQPNHSPVYLRACGFLAAAIGEDHDGAGGREFSPKTCQ